jgi:hypothetical protein
MKDRITDIAAILEQPSKHILPGVPADVRERIFIYALSGASAKELVDAYGALVVRDGYRRTTLAQLDSPFAELLALARRARNALHRMEREIRAAEERRDALRTAMDW